MYNIINWSTIKQHKRYFIYILISIIGGILRFSRLSTPNFIVFDETYYAKDAWALLNKGVELEWPSNINDDIIKNKIHYLPGFLEFVVHPPLGKWMIAIGELLFGFHPFGWRFITALIGTISIYLICLIAYRLTNSLLVSILSGIFITCDGLHVVLSRTAILDIFVSFFIITTLYISLLNIKPSFKWLLLGISVGCATSVKWNGLYYGIGIVLIYLITHNDKWYQALKNMIIFWLSIIITYISTWIGWFSNKNLVSQWFVNQGYKRSESNNMIKNFILYHEKILDFHRHLTAYHPYKSKPQTWPLLIRPVSFYYVKQGHTIYDILAIGTPLLWWFSIIAIIYLLYYHFKEYGVILLGYFANYLPWFATYTRTMFYFYSITLLPFMCIASAILIHKMFYYNKITRYASITMTVLIISNFIYFYPIYTALGINNNIYNSILWFNTWI